MSNGNWAADQLRKMNLEDAVGQLLMVDDRQYSSRRWFEIVKKNHLGSICIRETIERAGDYQDRLAASLEESEIPIILAADMENGLGCRGGQFPPQMAVGATQNMDFAEKRGHMIARMARSRGVHWVFNPVIDINYNPLSPEMNIRTFGDRWQDVRDFSAAQIRGIQKAGVAATAKHFPGAGMDDRDQHLCTSLNPLPMKEWMATYGQVWKAAIDAGVMTVMPGHIALPDYDGLAASPNDALPATLNAHLLQELLRKELGFKGVIVSDAATMIGLTSRCRAEDCCVEFLKAGGDVFLFANPDADFARVMTAVQTGELAEERVWEAARRVLELKAALGLCHKTSAETISAEEQSEVDDFSEELARKSATIAKGAEYFPVKLNKGDNVLTVTIRWPGAVPVLCPELTEIDASLRKLGCNVFHLENPPHHDLQDAPERYKYVFINVIVWPHAMMGIIRMVGPMIMPFWRAFYTGRTNCIFTSFGSPYLLHEQPHWPNLLLMYAPSAVCQRAAVDVWTGKCKAEGVAPVCLEETIKY